MKLRLIIIKIIKVYRVEDNINYFNHEFITLHDFRFYNSRVCQFLLGAGAINVSGLKTITIRNLALALRSLQLLLRIIPYILIHFQNCYSEKSTSNTLSFKKHKNENATPKAESKQFEVLHRQFDQASQHVKNHVDELHSKIFSVVTAILMQHISSWQPPQKSFPNKDYKVPSQNFKALCKQLTKLHDSIADIWDKDQIRHIFAKVHKWVEFKLRYKFIQ